MLECGLTKLREQILSYGSQDPYPYHVLGSQMLAYINTWVPSKSKGECLRELHREVTAGSNKHPLSTPLKSLVEDIKRAELKTAIIPS